MTIENSPQDKDDNTQQQQRSDNTDIAGESRRQFTKAGLAGSGVLMTLVARSSLACVALSPSGFTSINQSTHGKQVESLARSPGYWKNHPGWPGGLTHNTLFRAIFPVSNHSSGYYSVTLGNILIQQGFDVNNLGMHLTAAYLDALAGLSPFLPATTVVAMWNEWSATGYYKPTATVSWDAAQIVTYLSATET